MHTRDALQAMLNRNSLSRPDGRELWKYGAEVREHELLLSSFRAFRTCPRDLSLNAQGALALLVVRLLCDESEGSAWSWAPVWTALSWPEEVTHLYRHLEHGFMQFWCRPIRRLSRSGHRAFLGTCYVEGGLPLAWLHAEHSIGQTIRQLVALSELHGLPATALSQERMGNLAESIRGEEVADLCAQIAGCLVSLRARLPAGCEQPSRHLDSADPDWRAQLPLRVGQGHDANAIIDSLLSVSASRDVDPLVEIMTLLDVQTGRCRRRVRVADRITVQQLQQQTELGETDSAARLLYLFLQTDTGARHQIARLELRAEGEIPHWQVVRSGALPTLESTGEVRAMIGLRGHVYTEFVPPGGGVLETDAPWVFAEARPGVFSLVGVGSCSTERENALIVLHESSTAPEPLDQDSVVVVAAWPFSERVAFDVGGRVAVSGQGERFEITTRTHSAAESLELRGPLLRGANGHNAPYHGPPRVHVRTGASVLALPDDALGWKPFRQAGEWRSWVADPPRGHVVVCARTPNGRRLRVEARIVSAKFRIQLVQGRSLRIHAPGLERVEGSSPGVQVTRDSIGGFHVTFDEQTDRADAEFRLLFQGAAPLTVSLPIPGSRAGFVDECGKWLPSGSRFSIDLVDRIRARNASGERTQLEVRSQGFTWEGLEQLRPAGEGIAELYLEDLREELITRLRASGTLDDHLELQLAPLGYRKGPSRTLELGNYGLHVEASFSEDAAVLWARAADERALEPEENKRLSLWGMALGQPERPWFELPRLADGTWRAEFSVMEPGPYLAILQEGLAVRGRPRLVWVPGPLPEGSSEFRVVATIENTEERRSAWAVLCDAMAEQWGHSAWSSFRALIRTGSPLPACCFEVMQLAAQRPALLAQMMLRQNDSGAQREVMEEFEEVGVFWQALPISAWAAATKTLRRWLLSVPQLVHSLGGMAKSLGTLCPTLFGSLTPELRFLSVLGELAQRSLGAERTGMACLSLPGVVLQGLLLEEIRALCARHAEDHWPQPHLSRDLGDLAAAIRYPEHPPFRREILAAPYVAANLALRGQVLDRRDGYALRNARAFDRDWFDAAHTFHMASLIQADLRRYEELFQDA